MSDRGEDRAPKVGSRSTEVPDSVREELLKHPTREQVVELLAERPGLNKYQLCKLLDLDPNLLNFHLEALEDAHVLAIRPSAQGQEHLCFLEEDLELWEDPRTRILFGRRPVRDVGLYLVAHPGARTKEIAQALELTPATVRHHLRTLREHGLVERFRAGRTFLYEPDDALEAWAVEAGSAFQRPWLD